MENPSKVSKPSQEAKGSSEQQAQKKSPDVATIPSTANTSAGGSSPSNQLTFFSLDFNSVKASLPTTSDSTDIPPLCQDTVDIMIDTIRNPTILYVANYEKKMPMALETLKEFPMCKNFLALLKYSLSVLDSFKCNLSAAKLYKLQIMKIIYLIGQPQYGLVYHSTYVMQKLEAYHFAGIEAALSRAMRYMVRFTRDDYLTHMLVTTDPRFVFRQLDEQLVNATNALLTEFSFMSTSLLTPTTSYFVVCNVRPAAVLVAKEPQSITRLMTDMDIPPEARDSFIAEMGVILQYSDAVKANAELSISNVPQNAIKNKIVRDFWVKKLGAKQIVALSELSVKLREYLIESGLTTADAAATSSNFKKALQTQFNIFDDGQLELLDIAKLVRCIPSTEARVWDRVADFTHAQCKRIIPPPPTCRQVYWDPDQEFELKRVLMSRGWVNVEGPPGAGKTTRVLAVLHDMPMVDKDSLWIDFSKAGSEMEFVARFTSQLYLRNSVFKEDIVKSVRELLKCLRQGSVVVFDNIDATDLRSKTMNNFKSFITNMANLVNEFESKLCFVVISSVPLQSFGLFGKFYSIPALAPAIATQMAKELIPHAPELLLIAGRNLAGEMGRLAVRANVGTLATMYIALDQEEPVDSDGLEKIVSQGVANELTLDEGRCAKCLLRDLAPLDIAACWALAREVFEDDVLRFSIALQGLIDRGWLVSHGLGYSVPKDSQVPTMPEGAAAVTDSGQWDRYIEHFAREAVRLNKVSEETTSALEYFDCNRTHFRQLFSNFFPDESEQVHSNVLEIARILAGNINRLLKFRFSPISSVALSRRVYDKLPSDDEKKPLAAAELALQLLRYDDAKQAFDLMCEETNMYPEGDRSVAKARVQSVKGFVAASAGKKAVAKACFSEAFSIWNTSQFDANSNFDYAEAASWSRDGGGVGVTCGGLMQFPWARTPK